MFVKVLQPILVYLLVFAIVCLAQEESSKLFVVGGHNNYSDPLHSIDDVEALDVLDVGACPKPANFIEWRRGAVGTFIDGKPLVCGGTGPRGNIKTCHEYDNDSETWIEHENTMKISRRHASAVRMNDTHWWITGGAYESDVQNTTEIYDSTSRTFRDYVRLPQHIMYHTTVKVRDDLYFMAAGSYTDGYSHLFDAATETWTELPGSEVEHSEGFVGVITLADGTKEIVLAGGEGAGTSTEIYSFETNSWRAGPDFPISENFYGVSIAFQNSFLAVGGAVGPRDYSGAIFYLDPDTLEWVDMTTELLTPRKWFAAFLVPDDFITCGA